MNKPTVSISFDSKDDLDRRTIEVVFLFSEPIKFPMASLCGRLHAPRSNREWSVSMSIDFRYNIFSEENFDQPPSTVLTSLWIDSQRFVSGSDILFRIDPMPWFMEHVDLAASDILWAEKRIPQLERQIEELTEKLDVVRAIIEDTKDVTNEPI